MEGQHLRLKEQQQCNKNAKLTLLVVVVDAAALAGSRVVLLGEALLFNVLVNDDQHTGPLGVLALPAEDMLRLARAHDVAPVFSGLITSRSREFRPLRQLLADALGPVRVEVNAAQTLVVRVDLALRVRHPEVRRVGGYEGLAEKASK